jgi:hypothetical protein
MTTTDWILDIVLIALVLRQVREARIDKRFVAIPAGIVAYSGSHYLTSFPTDGNNLLYVGGLLALGVALGVAGGLVTHVRAAGGHAFARAGLAAAGIWVTSMSARMGFLVWVSYGSGQDWLRDYSVAHHVTSGDVWQTGLVLLALSEVIVRLAIIVARSEKAKRAVETAPAALQLANTWH